MKQCWEKFGAGDLDLFPNWWALLGYENEPDGILDYIKVWNLKFQEIPRYCVPCSRIRFDTKAREEIYNTYPDGKVTSLYEWMGNSRSVFL